MNTQKLIGQVDINHTRQIMIFVSLLNTFVFMTLLIIFNFVLEIWLNSMLYIFYFYPSLFESTSQAESTKKNPQLPTLRDSTQ